MIYWDVDALKSAATIDEVLKASEKYTKEPNRDGS
jgi:hypothetical protein